MEIKEDNMPIVVLKSGKTDLSKKQSLNEERVNSSRVRGELGIIADSSKLSFFINWGDFANISDANIYYYINNYGFWEENWEMSNNGQISYSPGSISRMVNNYGCSCV